MSRRFVFHFAASLIPLLIVGCVTTPRKTPPSPVSITIPVPSAPAQTALLRIEEKDIPAFEDDFDTASLHAAVLQSKAYYESLPRNQSFIFGPDTYTASEMGQSMASLAELLEASQRPGDWVPLMMSSFTVYQSVGSDFKGTVTFSSYYEPTVPARLERSNVFKFPLYGRPSDLIDVDLSRFNPGYEGAHISGRREGRMLLPYMTRAQIDGEKALQGQSLELAWAKDSFDVLDLQIEGTGWLDLGGGHLLRVRYDGDNGHRYRSVGQYLISSGRIPAKKFNRQTMRRYLAKHPKDRQRILNVNERYVFFRLDTSTAAAYAYGDIDVALTPGRSIATDPKVFPKGALVWIDTERSIVDSRDRVVNRKPLKRFMLTQDEGGAIQGPGRVDIFAGHGEDAKALATHLWYQGKLYFLVKKKR